MDFHIETDLTLLCRVCMKDTTGFDTENIFADRDSDMPNIYNMLRVVCAAVFSSGDTQEQEARESLGMPKVVCLDCKQRVLAAYDLHERCVETDGKLWEMIMIKQELQEEEVLEVTDPLEESIKEGQISQVVENKTQGGVDSIDNSGEKVVKLEDNSDHTAEQARETNLLDTPLQNSVADPQDTNERTDNHENSASESKSRDLARKTCELCATVCKSIPSLRIHMKKAHPQQIRSCFECDAVFFSEVMLQDHLMYHLTGRAHGCLICKKRFSTTTGLRSHSRTHTDFEPVKCTLCDKSFVTENVLKQHMILHTGVKRFACDRCPSRFRTKGTLKTHMFTHIAERNTVCDICGARFKMAKSMAKHNRIHEGAERPFPCSICNVRFVTRNHLNRHMRTHTGEKPYKCAYCDRAFAQSNDLVKHSKFHVGDKPYQCDRCDASFRLISDLRNHYKVHIQPGEGDAAKNATMSEDEVLRFTSVSVLNRRFEQEKLRDKQRKDTEEQ